jgi:ABC-2 type transport system permease protein
MSPFQEYLRIFRLHIRMQMNLPSPGARGGKRPAKETAKLLGFGALILYAAAAVLSLYVWVLYPFMKKAAELEEASGIGLLMPLMGGVVLASMLMVLVLGTLTLLALVFGARDAGAFAALPVREQSVFMAKFSVVYCIELAASALIFWPAAVIYGIVSNLSFPYFFFLIIRAVPVWFLLPMVPMALAALLSMAFTRLTALARRRDLLLTIFGMVLVFSLVIGQASLMGHFAPMLGDEEAVALLLTENGALLEAVTRSFPPAMWASLALLGQDAAGGLLGAFGLFASAALGCYICLLLSRRLYYKGVLAQSEAPKMSKKLSQTSVKAGSAFGAFFFKEVKIILRTPVYAMNILTGTAIFPIMFIAVSFGAGSGGLSAGSESMAKLFELLTESSGDIKLLLAAGVVMLTGVMGSVCVSTTFSREGRNLWLCQIVPVPVRTQLEARISVGFMLTAAGSVLSLAVLKLIGFTVMELSFGMILGLSAAFPVLVVSVIPDALKPKRKWNSESEAIKQNINTVLALLIGLGLAVGIGFAAFGLQKLMPVWAAGGIVAAAGFFLGLTLLDYAVRITENMLKTVDG